jgi:NAD(P)-dependent dehydrogenase (short-subunit alcohol dehydrogenase family)
MLDASMVVRCRFLLTAHIRIITPFNRESTADETLAGVDLTGKRAIVTGGGSGIGAETARALAAVGAQVTLAVRNTRAGETVAAEMRSRTGNGSVAVAPLDLTDRASIAAFVATWRGPLHLLINNAGVVGHPPLKRTRDGWELHFATDHLGHFGLALGLHASLAAAGQARIVVVSCGGHQLSPVVFDDLHFVFRPYDPALAQGQSNTANVLFAVGASARWCGDGIAVNVSNPGLVSPILRRQNGRTPEPPTERRRSLRQRAATSVLLAGSPLLDGVSGRYFEDCNEAERVTRRTEDLRGVASYALNPENADRLWETSLDLLED